MANTADMVGHEVRDGIARITLNSPEAANALGPEQRDLLIELFMWAPAPTASSPGRCG
jgi:enoyl-CoA hydratase/carnithine racemase